MTLQEKINFKHTLRQFCQSVIEQRIAAAKTIIDNAQEAANSEEKSSAGDKYETSRAMSHLEKDMHARQLAEHLRELSFVHTIDTSVLQTNIGTGAFIHCNEATFFIATGLGKQMVEGKTIWFLSPQAPLSKLLWNKKAGDTFLFNGKNAIISEVY